jgi:hypothetical protein
METLAARYERLQREMETLHAGAALESAADAVAAVLPTGRLTLVSTSDQGAAVAAVCAARRAGATTWRKVDLLAPPAAADGAVVVIEPVDTGAAWRQAIERRYPNALVVIANEVGRAVAAAA